MSDCCLRCHFDFEEQECLPHLPLPLQQELLRQHEVLKRRGYPFDEVEAHARWEERVLAQYCPPDVMRRVYRDHDLHADGLMDAHD